MPLDDHIGALYALPLNQFVAARTALAKTVRGDEAKEVKALAKPTVLAWAVNQVYWHARPVYDKLLKAGAGLRKAQIAALEGRTADVRDATAVHRAAIGAAVKEALALASRANASPAADDLSRLFEAVSLNESLEEPHGRLTAAVAPAGFEALLGVAVKAPVRDAPAKAPAPGKDERAAGSKRDEAAIAALEKKRAEEERRRQQAIARAEKAVAEAKADEVQARRHWEAAEERLAAARRALEELRERSA